MMRAAWGATVSNFGSCFIVIVTFASSTRFGFAGVEIEVVSVVDWWEVHTCTSLSGSVHLARQRFRSEGAAELESFWKNPLNFLRLDRKQA